VPPTLIGTGQGAPGDNISSNTPFVAAVCVMITLGVILSVLIIMLRPQSDPLVVCVTVFGIISPTTLSLLAFMKSQQTHLSVNSRLDDFIFNSASAAHAEGKAQGMTEGMNLRAIGDAAASQKKEPQ
jgi:hypothetical protein